jgi:hypothetical protein
MAPICDSGFGSSLAWAESDMLGIVCLLEENPEDLPRINEKFVILVAILPTTNVKSSNQSRTPTFTSRTPFSSPRIDDRSDRRMLVELAELSSADCIKILGH